MSLNFKTISHGLVMISVKDTNKKLIYKIIQFLEIQPSIFIEFLKYGFVLILDDWSASSLQRIWISDNVWNPDAEVSKIPKEINFREIYSIKMRPDFGQLGLSCFGRLKVVWTPNYHPSWFQCFMGFELPDFRHSL